MVRRKKQSFLSSCFLVSGIAFAILILLFLISQYRGAFFGLIVIALIIYIIYRLAKSSSPQIQPTHAVAITTQPSDISALVTKPALYVPSYQDIQHKLQWYGKGTELKIGKYIVNDPMTYYSEAQPMNSFQSITSEPSCIYSPLPIGIALDEGKGALGYWPHYSRVTPNQRANYLEWLAGGRKGTLNDIGYAFLFFYGLERRALIEKKDIGLILQEVVLLLTRYTQSGSFNTYLSSFIAYVVSRIGLDKINQDQFRFLFEKTTVSTYEAGLATGLAWLYRNSTPLPVNWARKVASFDSRTTKSVVVDRFPAKFTQLFSLRYKEHFDKGIVLHALNKDRGIDYFPASSSFHNIIPHTGNSPLLPTAIIPNILGLQHQFDPISDIWNQCVEELKPLSRKLSRGISTESREAYEALPDELRKLADHPDHLKWNKVIENYTREDGISLPKISVLAETQGIEKKLSLTIKESIGLAETAGYMKLAIEPDPRANKLPYKWDDAVALYYPNSGNTVTNNPDYVSASFILELGISVAYADGIIDRKEANQISQSLGYLFTLDPTDLQRLEALKQVLIYQKPSLQNLKKRFHKSLSEADLEKISAFLISVANADGSISQNEVSVLKRIYRAFGVETDRIRNLITMLQSPPTEPVVIREGKGIEGTGEKIPEPISNIHTINLDKGKLDKLIKDTNGVSTLIRRAMIENGGIVSVGLGNDSRMRTIDENSPKSGLDKKYYKVLTTILKIRKCERKAFEKYARECGVMPNAAIEAINEWSYGRFGQNLVRDDDVITVNDHVYLRIKNELNDKTRRT